MEKLKKFKRRQPEGYVLFIGVMCFLFVIFLAFLGGGLGWNTSQNDKLHSRKKLSIGDRLRFNRSVLVKIIDWLSERFYGTKYPKRLQLS